MTTFTNSSVAYKELQETLHPFICDRQRQVMIEILRGEENQFMIDKILELAEIVKAMPSTGETDNTPNPVIYLHYFGGGYDAWITEKDIGDETDDKRQHQAFGKARFYGNEAEFGYISIEELKANHIELDLHFIPKPMKVIA